LIRLRVLWALATLLVIMTGPTSAAECLGKPDALGTSRTLMVDPIEHVRIGTMQYPETLPLADHEVVLTFDDGPLPPYTSRVLDILASECVKATFFLVGQMAKAHPGTVRQIHAAASHGVPARIRDAALGLSMSIGRATAIPHPAGRQDRQS
jgi:peptidoglycan/xylan/chitin deacetylase (PgdA/CDA1 family)